ncbi:pericentrin-like [Ostrinia nubilalis]|uniref:pericentrin-like n=1 Tax=Ostrinia nubilalis TaxID=29057 RepID=UPI00308262A3
MDDPQKQSSQSTEIKNVLPDVVHSQQIAAVGAVESAVTQIDNSHNIENESQNQDVQETSETESISEHIPSKVDSLSVTDNVNHTQSEDLLKVEGHQEKVSKSNSPNIPFTYSPFSEHPSSPDPSKQSTSWPIDVNAVSDIHHISEESPVNLALSSEDFSKDGETNEGKSQSLPHTPSANDHGKTPQESPRSDNFVDSLNEESVLKSLESENDKSLEKSSMSRNQDSLEKDSTGSEEIIKLDIRGQGVPKFPLPTAKIIFGPPPEGSTVIDSNIEQMPVFPNLLSPFLVGAGDGIKVEEVFDFDEQEPKDISLDKLLELSPDKSLEVSPDKSMELSLDKQSFSSDKSEQKDLLVEELTVDDVKEREDEKLDEPSLGTQPKSMPPEETMSFSTMFSTMTTDYKTICEEYHAKLVHFEAAITQRDELIEELTVSLQRSVRERDELRHENEHLSNEVLQLQHSVGERSSSDHDTVKAQLSDFMKYQSMLKDDSTKFYSALMSGGSSIQSSNGEKDMDHEEITVNYSKSDLRSSGSSEEFQTGFENKLTTIISKFDEYIEENLRNKLRESIIQILCEEIGKMRIESDTEVKELETQMQQDKQTFTVETRRLRELLASVKAGNADIDELRAELSIKHEKEMENLRTYFEKKCSDMERSYSEEVWRGRACLSPGGSASSLEGSAAGDCLRRRTRSAELPSLTLESTPLEQAVKQTSKKYEQQLEELRAEHLAYISDLQARHAETVASLEEQVTQLKAHIQTSENTEANVSVYQQDIDLELEKKRFEARVEQVRQDVVHQLQEQIQVLLSDPDAEVSSWPLELVALRDKIHGDARLNQEKELSSLRDELSGGEDKWKQRRNVSFDQNRHLEEVTRERDGLKRVAVSLHRVVGQLVAYCASAEDELNRTVLSHLLARVLPDADDWWRLCVGRGRAQPDRAVASAGSSAARRGRVSVVTSCVSRDGLKRVVGQLVETGRTEARGGPAGGDCASAEDELNRTVLSHLLARVLPDADDWWRLCVGRGRAQPDRAVASAGSSAARRGRVSVVTSCVSRDGLKRVVGQLVETGRTEARGGQLVAYCASAEDELNRTVLSHLLARVLPDADETIVEEESRPSTPNLSTELNTSLVSRGKHVHFAPDLHSILSELDEESVLGFLQQQRDVSADIKRELESSLQRLRQEAHELLELSARLTHKERNESKMLESGQVQITELVQDLDTNQNSCDNCELHRKNMEEAMAECLQRENLLRSDLEGAMIKIAHLMTSNERHSSDLIAEGYGTGQQLQAALSSARMSPRPRSCHTPGTMSLDGCSSPRAHVSRLAQDLEMLHKERDDLQQQLEAANRQLRSTRQFVEEQASEREAERDEFAKRLADLREENARLATRLQNNARILNEMHRLRLSQCACRSQDAQVEQLEAQTREMNQIINELETRKAASDEELKATEEKIILLRDIIANLESQLEQKTTHETEILDELDTMKKTIEERDSKMRSLLGELESLRSERLEQTDVTCVKCGSEEDKYSELMDKVKEQCRWLEERIHRRTARLERIHEVCSTSCSEPSEDVSLRDQRDVEVKSPESPPTPRNENLVELLGIWESLEAHSRAEDAALKRVRDLEMQRAQLKDVAQVCDALGPEQTVKRNCNETATASYF